MDEPCSRVKSFFDYGSPLFILSIRHGHIDVADIAAQLQADPIHVKTFFQWMNGTVGNGIVRALVGWDVTRHVTNRDRRQVVVAVYTIALLYNFQSVVHQLPRLHGQQHYIDYVQQYGNDLNNDFFISVCGEGNIHLAKYLITLPDIDGSARDNWPVQWASFKGHLDVVEFLSTLPGVDASAYGSWAVRQASHNGHLAIVQFLVTLTEVDASVLNNWPIRLASENGHLAVVQFLSKLRGVDVSALDNFAIRGASRFGHLAVVRFLSTLPGVDASARDNDAVRCASYNGHLAVVQFLLTLPEVTINREEAEKISHNVKKYDVRWFWKSYIDDLDQRKNK